MHGAELPASAEVRVSAQIPAHTSPVVAPCSSGTCAYRMISDILGAGVLAEDRSNFIYVILL
jgi:hypothetical protein